MGFLLLVPYEFHTVHVIPSLSAPSLHIGLCPCNLPTKGNSHLAVEAVMGHAVHPLSTFYTFKVWSGTPWQTLASLPEMLGDLRGPREDKDSSRLN